MTDTKLDWHDRMYSTIMGHAWNPNPPMHKTSIKRATYRALSKVDQASKANLVFVFIFLLPQLKIYTLISWVSFLIILEILL